jgi:hypothetical protein
MEKAKLTPLDFGLAVRGHPSSLMVTARNKLGSGRTTVSIGLSSQFVETARLNVKGTSLEDNRQTARRFIASLRDAGFTHDAAKPVSGGRLLQRVPVAFVDRFLGSWVNADQSLTTQIPPIRKYIDDRKVDELSEWDVLVGSLANGRPVPMFENWSVVPMERKILMSDLSDDFLSIGGSKMRVSSRNVERIGVSDIDALNVEDAHFKKKGTLNFPGYIYRPVRPRPLLALYSVQIKQTEGDAANAHKAFPKAPVIAWAISFPKSKRPYERVEYVINTVKHRELFGDEDDDEGSPDDQE